MGSGIKRQISGFEAAAVEFEPAMKAVREYHIDPHMEMKDGKLKDTFSVFRKRVGPKKEEESETTLEGEESEEEEPKERVMMSTLTSLMRTSSLRMRKMKKKMSNQKSLPSRTGQMSSMDR